MINNSVFIEYILIFSIGIIYNSSKLIVCIGIGNGKFFHLVLKVEKKIKVNFHVPESILFPWES